MIEVTNEAYTKLTQKAVLEDNFSFRLGVTGGGCGGMEYLFAFSESSYSDDLVLDWGKIRFRIDPHSAEYLTGMTIDWQTNGLNEQFVFNNPKETYRCGCGESIGF
jgi:iron-sulfur cluster assembly accessory protein